MKIRYRGFKARPFIRLEVINIGSTKLYCWGPVAIFITPRNKRKEG